jgi:hypothetical protein
MKTIEVTACDRTHLKHWDKEYQVCNSDWLCDSSLIDYIQGKQFMGIQWCKRRANGEIEAYNKRKQVGREYEPFLIIREKA